MIVWLAQCHTQDVGGLQRVMGKQYIGREGVLVGVKHIIWIKKKDPKEGCFGGGGIDG